MNESMPMPYQQSLRFSPVFEVCIAALVLAWSTAGFARAPDFYAFDELLLQNVRNGFVDYDGIAADQRFGVFVEQVGADQPMALDGPDRGLAFYINAYNALAIQGVLNDQSPTSWWGRRKFFKQQKYAVLGEKINLESLQRDRIVVLGDPRIHFAIVCASLSCPRLSSRAYLPDQVNVQLHDAAVRFINDPTRNRFDLERRIAFVSMIFEWHADDFARAGGSLQRYLARFVDDAEVQEALRAETFEIRYLEYDWNLNGYYSEARN